MNKIEKINTLIKRLKADGCQIVSTYHEPSKQEITIKHKDYKGHLITTTYRLDKINL